MRSSPISTVRTFVLNEGQKRVNLESAEASPGDIVVCDGMQLRVPEPGTHRGYSGKVWVNTALNGSVSMGCRTEVAWGHLYIGIARADGSGAREDSEVRTSGFGRGVQKHDRALRPASASGLRECRAVIRSLLYLLLRRVLGLVGQNDRMAAEAELEIAVLRHQVTILRRRVKRPVYRASDRAFLAAASRMLRREAWGRSWFGPRPSCGGTGSW